MSNTETPNYQLIQSDDNIEIRRYEPMIVAEVEIKGKRRDVASKGFRLLADYIFGNNIAIDNDDFNTSVKQKKNMKIAMTAPVQQQPQGDTWLISFVMPSKHTMATLPKPLDERVTLKELPAQTFISITFSGTSSERNIQKHEEKLIQYINDKKIKAVGDPKYAFYNPPWVLPLMRRNEIMFEIIQ